MKFLRRLFCKHELHFVRNLYGDEIIEWGFKRSIWRCNRCGHISTSNLLHNTPPATSKGGAA